MFGSGLDENIQEGRETLPQIYCDMDEVLVALRDGTEKILGKKYNDKSWKNSDEKKALLNKKGTKFFP